MATTVTQRVIGTPVSYAKQRLPHGFVLSGDMSDGDDKLLMSGDMSDGDDVLLLSGDAITTVAANYTDRVFRRRGRAWSFRANTFSAKTFIAPLLRGEGVAPIVGGTMTDRF